MVLVVLSEKYISCKYSSTQFDDNENRFSINLCFLCTIKCEIFQAIFHYLKKYHESSTSTLQKSWFYLLK